MTIKELCKLTDEKPKNEEQAKKIDDVTLFLLLFSVKNPGQLSENEYFRGMKRGLALSGLISIPFDETQISLTSRGEYKFHALENSLIVKY